MPVSRKRKKKGKSTGQRSLPQQPSGGGLLAEFAEHRRMLDRRRSKLAMAAADRLVPELTTLAEELAPSQLEDAICARLGSEMFELESMAQIERQVSPDTFLDAVVHAALDGQTSPIVVACLSRIAPKVLMLDEVLPKPSAAPAIVSPVLWARDGYGSRFAIVAEASGWGGDNRWYLWDVDACGYMPATVHSGYYGSLDDALAAWKSGVGSAATEASLAPVNDYWLASELLPGAEGMMRVGGEDAAQLAEYHRSRRLAEAVEMVIPRTPHVAPRVVSTQAAAQFTEWLTTHRPDLNVPKLAEQIEELADFWTKEPAGLYHTCSAHRVTTTAANIQDYYQEDFAAELRALLPDWARWLNTENDAPQHLAERSLASAHKAAQILPLERPETLNRVIE